MLGRTLDFLKSGVKLIDIAGQPQNWINLPYGGLSHIFGLIGIQIHVNIHSTIKNVTEKTNIIIIPKNIN